MDLALNNLQRLICHKTQQPKRSRTQDNMENKTKLEQRERERQTDRQRQR